MQEERKRNGQIPENCYLVYSHSQFPIVMHPKPVWRDVPLWEPCPQYIHPDDIKPVKTYSWKYRIVPRLFVEMYGQDWLKQLSKSLPSFLICTLRTERYSETSLVIVSTFPLDWKRFLQYIRRIDAFVKAADPDYLRRY
jgi:hypothetical protein